MTIIILLLTIFLKIVITIRVPTSWTDQIEQQSLQQLKPYGSHERHQNLNFQQDGWVPIQPPPHYYLPKPKLTKFKKVHPLNEEHATKFAANPQENRPDRATNRKPDGYELFEKNSNLFNRKRAQFRDNPDFPEPKSGRFLDEDRDGEGLSTEFTPTRLYTQVRHFNDRQHLSRDEAEDPRLREVIRDSKIHTVYTEDGYEDSGYDHGGHEKNAEEDAGYVEFDKETETEGDNRDNNGDLEISSEIKLVKSPKNNGTETHKYVKIAPKSIDNKRKKRTINEKFPYYNRYGVNQDSPLRYSENFANIPDKQHDNLAFYQQADRIKCDEVESGVDPVPERIKNNDDGTVGDVGAELAKMPRLRQLGDKIDCFKLKYFGENPLDNPLFDEVTIAPVKSIFNQLSIQEEAVNSTVNDENLGTKILNDIVEQQQRNGKDLVDAASPVSGALLGKRRRRLKPKRPYFIHRFPPTRTPFRTSTTPATISEVHYKTEIKPDEQFNVLNDIINNIKNSPKEPLASGSNFVYLTSTTKPKHPNLDADDSLQYENLELLKIGVVRSTKLPKITTTSTTEHQEIDEKFNVVGLSPPTPNRYKTINDKLDNTPINQFYFDGMKPPPIQQKFFVYHDFKAKMKQHRRCRRAAQRQNYSQVRNRNKPIDIDDNEDEVVITSDDDDDDYVPHRPKNYHYDEKLGRIVYDKTTQSTDNNEELEDIVEVLITEAPLPKPTRRTQLKFTNNPDEPSFLQFLKTLKSHSDYKQITEPPITEKSITTTTIRTSSVESVPTRPAEFLGVLSKIRADPGYHKIGDKNETRQTTTTVIPEEITEEDVEEPVQNVQNSRGSGVLTTGQNFQIFDINDYLPKIKNYSFRTSIDTTKYKTIERPSGRRKQDGDSVEEARESSEISTVMTTIKPTTTTTVRRLRNRPKLPTTTTTTTTERIESTTREKAKRVYPRRRVARIRLTTTTEENPTKIVHRRHQPETTPTPSTTEANKSVTIFKDYDKAKRHGGNYRRQDDFGEKLSDVVPKPIMFYTDPTLPNNINRLVETNPTISPIEDLADNEYDDRTDEETEEIDNDDGKAKISKKTAFIKDPSQRLYYYAPI